MYLSSVVIDLYKQVIFESNEPVEGARMYKIRGTYYIWITKPGDEQRVLKSIDGIYGPYECRQVLNKVLSPLPGSAPPHQGALIDTADGRWFYMAFIDAYPGGRLPVLAPVDFDYQGWPQIVCDQTETGKGWSLKYATPLPHNNRSMTHVGPYRDTFVGYATLNPRWEWNHNPDDTKWRIGNQGLELQTACVTTNLYHAANTLTHRILGPKSQATFAIDFSAMISGDRVGVGVFRDESSYIGIHRGPNRTELVYVDDIRLQEGWKVASHGRTQVSGLRMDQHHIWLRVQADITPAFHGREREETRYAKFFYSMDGEEFVPFGQDYPMKNSWEWYLGYRFAVSNFATVQLGGRIAIKSFELERFA